MAINGEILNSASQTIGSFTNATTLNVTLSPAPTVGNILIAAVSCRTQSVTVNSISLPSGFTRIFSTFKPDTAAAIGWKVATASDTTFSATITIGNNTDPALANFSVFEFSSTDLSVSRINASSQNTSFVATSTKSLSTGTANLTTPSGLAIAFLAAASRSQWAEGRAWSNSFVEKANTSSSQPARPGVFIATKVLNSSGAVTSTVNNSTTLRSTGYTSLILFGSPDAAVPGTEPDPNNPPAGKIVKQITTIPDANAESFVNYTDPKLEVGDYIVVDEKTSPSGFNLTINNDGTFEYNAGGNSTRQSFKIDVWEASASGYIGETTFYVNNDAPVFDPSGTEPDNPILIDALAGTKFTGGQTVSINLDEYFLDEEGVTLTYSEDPETTNTLSEIELTISSNTLSGNITTNTGIYLVTIRGTDDAGDYDGGIFRFSVESYPFNREQDLLYEDGGNTFSTNTEVLLNIVPDYETPSNVIISGIEIDIQSANANAVTFITPNVSEFLTGSWNSIPWGSELTVETIFPTAPNACTTITFTGPEDSNEANSNNWFGLVPYRSPGIFSGLKERDVYYIEVSQGLLKDISLSGILVGNKFNGDGFANVWSYSSANSSWEFKAQEQFYTDIDAEEPPPTGKLVTKIEVLPSTDAASFVNYVSPRLKIDDLIVTDTTTTPGNYPIFVNNDGTFGYDARGDSSRQYTYVNIFDNASKTYAGEIIFYVNNEFPRFADSSGDPIVLNYSTEETITDIQLTSYFVDYEGDVLTFSVPSTSENTFADTGLTLAGSTITGQTTANAGIYKVTVRATDITGDYTDGVFWFTISSEAEEEYEYEDPQILFFNGLEFSVGQTVTMTFEPPFETPTGMKLEGIPLTFNAGANNETASFNVPALTEFISGDWRGIPWFDDLLVEVEFPTAPTLTSYLKLVGPTGSNIPGSVYWYGRVESNQGIFANVPVGTPWVAEVRRGTISQITNTGSIIAATPIYNVAIWIFPRSSSS